MVHYNNGTYDFLFPTEPLPIPPTAVNHTLGHSYLVLDDKMTFDQARQSCHQKGYYLAYIESEQEQRFIESFLAPYISMKPNPGMNA